MYDLIGIGFGPSNIALAIALEEILGRDEMSSRILFLEKQATSAWHPDMMLPRAFLQVSFLKDLVTMRNPASPYSFLNFQKAQDRLYEFVNLRTFYPSRQEFAAYIQWVADQFADIVRYGKSVKDLAPIRDVGSDRVSALLVEDESGEVHETRHLAVATGGKPILPAAVEPLLGERVFHSSEYLRRIPKPESLSDAVVAVVGSGQSAAEIIYHLASESPNAQVISIIRDFALRPIDASKFINEAFFARNVDYIYNLPSGQRKVFLESLQSTVYSVVDPELINDLYRLIYEAKIAGRDTVRFLQYGDLDQVSLTNDRPMFTWKNRMTGESGSLAVDYLVLATGFSYDKLPPPLEVLDDFALHDGSRLLIERDYRLSCRDDFEPGIYLQGFAEHSHGIAETALSLTAYRAGVIAESIVERLRLEHSARGGSAEEAGNGKVESPKVQEEEHVP